MTAQTADMPPAPKRIVFGITGGIAAYKAVGAIRALVLGGHRVDVIATRSALEFVGAPTLEAISRRPLNTSLTEHVAEVRHVALGQHADLVIVAPCTANTLAKMAAGIADDLLGTTLLATRAPVLVAPAMHTEMWQHAATAANVAVLRERGVQFVGPASGQLTGTDSGPGRLAEVDEIVAAARAMLDEPVQGARDDAAGSGAGANELAGLRVLISAGGTHEALDPVRFIGNRSSGKQGLAIAREAARRGARVTAVLANVSLQVPDGVEATRVSSAAELRAAMLRLAPEHDVVIMAAAVADYRPAEASATKIKKESTGEELTLTLVKNPDILRDLTSDRAARGEPGPLIVGFAAETEPDATARLAEAKRKIARKGCDLLIVNDVSNGAVFGLDENAVEIVDPSGGLRGTSRGTKMSVAASIVDAVATEATARSKRA